MGATPWLAYFNSSVALIEQAKQERQRLLQHQSQRTIARPREIIARLDEVLAGAKRR